jgi:hypothetical protein
MPCIAMTPAEWRPRGVLTGKIGLQIANVYAGLKRTNPALWYHPTSPGNVTLKSPAIAGLNDEKMSRCKPLRSVPLNAARFFIAQN